MQIEVYPSLILFPAEKKKPLLYEGDMAVVDVIKFVAKHASYFNHLISEKGNYFDVEHTIVVLNVDSKFDHIHSHCWVPFSSLFLFLVSTR